MVISFYSYFIFYCFYCTIFSQNRINIQSTFNIKKERINKLIKDIKRQGFGFRNFKNFKTKIYIALNVEKERTKFVLSRC
ncbi:transposase [Streptococcus suis]